MKKGTFPLPSFSKISMIKVIKYLTNTCSISAVFNCNAGSHPRIFSFLGRIQICGLNPLALPEGILCFFVAKSNPLSDTLSTAFAEGEG
jgi:hypothetical protein